MQLEHFLEASAKRHPDKIALICRGERLSYAEIERRSNRLAHGLREQGVRRGDRVAVYLGNSIEAVLSIFATLKAGGVFMMINPTTKADKLAYVLNNSRARALVVESRRVEALRSCFEQTPHLDSVITVGDPTRDGAAAGKRAVGFETLTDPSSGRDGAPKKFHIDIDLASLIYTSGSTGRPKGVMMTHANMVSASTSITTYLEEAASDIILNVLPLSFDYGLYQVLMAFQVGATLVLERSFVYPRSVIERLVEEKVTGFPIVPTILAILLQLDIPKGSFPDLKFVTNTGAALPTTHIRRLRELLPHVRIFSMYGLTECKRVSYLPPDQIDVRPDSVGIGMPNTEVYVVDDDGDRVPPRTVGELVVRGGNVMKGYWEAPDATGAVLRPGPLPCERVLHTGDLFWADEEGFLYFVARKDDIIKTRGEKVSPKEVENVLYAIDGVREAAVVGVDDPILGQAVKAILVTDDSARLDEQRVLRHCAERLEDFMVPKIVEFVNELPKTSSGKIRKTGLQTNESPSGPPVP